MSSNAANLGLTVIIPIGGKSPSTEVLLSWMTADILKKIKIILILDGLEIETSSNFYKSLDKLISSNLRILETDCKNPGGARNRGISLVDTPWMAFWDSDDIPEVDHVLRAILESPPSRTVIRGGYSLQDIKNGRIVVFEEEKLTNDMSILFQSGPGLWRYIFKTESVLNVRFPELSMAEDQIYLFKALTSAESIAEDSRIFYTYQMNNSNQLTNSRNKLKDLFAAFELLVDVYNTNPTNKTSSFEMIIARMLLTTRLNPILFVKTIFSFLSTKQIGISIKIGILNRMLRQITLHLRSR